MSKKPRIGEHTPLEELAALVCTTLEAHGISVVLSGGAVVSIYSDAEYVSYDLDFIPIGLARKVELPPEYGLIAEEVAEIFPDLVVYDEQGEPFTVKYHLMAPMLLNEVQKQEHRDGEHLRRIEEQQQTIERQQLAIEMLLARTEHLDTAGTPHGPRR